MKRVISLYLPEWSITLRRKSFRSAESAEVTADAPLVIAARTGRRRVIVAADALARRMGVRYGMAVAQASALVPGLLVEIDDPAGDAAALEQLAHWALKRYSPIVGMDTDGLRIDATGCAHLFGGEEAMLAEIVGQLRKNGVAAEAAMAPTYGAAHALARFCGKDMPACITEPLPALRRLPVAALRLPEEIVQGLDQLGFTQIGDLLKVPRATLALRFGPEPGRRLNQALGLQSEPFEPVNLPETLVTERLFAEPIATAESLALVTRLLVEELCPQLETRQIGAKRLDLRFIRTDDRIEAVRITLAQPARDAKRLTKLLCDKIETVDPGLGVERMQLFASWTGPLAYAQPASELGGTTKPDLATLVDSLQNRLQPRQLYRLAPVESDVPERSIRRVAPMTVAVAEYALPGPRPVRLLTPPEPIETIALLPDHPPVSFTWRGDRHRVTRADGPERIFGEWWKRDAELEAVRDYFQLEDDSGERFWVYRSGDGVHPQTGSHRWFLHGFFA